METVRDIWRELGAGLRRFVGNRVGDPHVADDITQDVMLKVQVQLGSLPPEGKLPAWVFAVARNAVIDYYRTRGVRGHDADIAGVEPVADEDGQRDTLRDLTPCLLRMVELLPGPYRASMKMADIEGLSQREVAEQAGISLSGAKSRVLRGRQMLREMVEDCCRIERDGRGNAFDYETTERSARYCGTDEGDDHAKCGI